MKKFPFYILQLVALIFALEHCKRFQPEKLPEVKYCDSEEITQFQGGCFGDCGNLTEDKKLPKLMLESGQSFEFYSDGIMYHNICCHGEGNFKGTWRAEDKKIIFQANYYIHPTDCLYSCAEDFSEKLAEKLKKCNEKCYASFTEIFGKPVVKYKITGALTFPDKSSGRMTMTMAEESPKKPHESFNYPIPYSDTYVGCVRRQHSRDADDWTDQPNPMY